MTRMKRPRPGHRRARGDDSKVTTQITVPSEFYRKMRKLSRLHEKTMSELIQHAIEVHYSDAAVSARHRLIDRLARLEADIGDREILFDEIAQESRAVRTR